MKRLMTTLRRALLRLQIMALDMQIYGATKTLEQVACPILANRVENARHIARTGRNRLICRYNALLPIGQNKIWSLI